MTIRRCTGPFPAGTALLLWLAAALFLAPAPEAGANQDVYGILPADTRVLQHSLADFDGDERKELAVLYETAAQVKLTVFRGDSGHWTRWWDDPGLLERTDGVDPKSLETADINGDGRAEMLAYYLTDNNTAMSARVLSLDEGDREDPAFSVILEDKTSPPGYPLLGKVGASFSVTFMRMASRQEDGYRRVYCWDGEAFERCREVVWEKP